MLVSVEGVYRNGHIELTESPNNLPEGTLVIDLSEIYNPVTVSLHRIS